MRRRTRLARGMRPVRRVDGRAFRYASNPARPCRPVARHGALCAVFDGGTASSRAAVGRRPARAAAGARCGEPCRRVQRRIGSMAATRAESETVAMQTCQLFGEAGARRAAYSWARLSADTEQQESLQTTARRQL